jgi:hypothetical protein
MDKDWFLAEYNLGGNIDIGYIYFDYFADTYINEQGEEVIFLMSIQDD